jgi:hypothetical protein
MTTRISPDVEPRASRVNATRIDVLAAVPVRRSCQLGELARQLTLVFDAASARSVVQARSLDGLAVATATALLDAASVKRHEPKA